MEDTQIIALYLSRQEAAVRLCAASMVLYTVWLLIPAIQTTKSRQIRIWLHGTPFRRKFPEC